jgi:hypothetical protein
VHVPRYDSYPHDARIEAMAIKSASIKEFA